MNLRVTFSGKVKSVSYTHLDVYKRQVFKFRDAQARAGDAVTEVCVKPTVVEVKILEEKGRIKDVWTLSRDCLLYTSTGYRVVRPCRIDSGYAGGRCRKRL